ncbi:MAG: type IV secretion system DNA-binding domain-containing protein [Candidatus Paceibacterota bacterium]
MYNPNQITYFGETDFRGKKVRFGIKAEDRSRHVYIIGKTGMGKSTLLENMAAQDIKNGEGMCFIDPHGSAIDTLLDYIPEERLNDVVYFAPFDSENPISFNILETVAEDQKHLVVQGLMSTFDKIWPDTFSERMRYILSNTLLALLEYPGSTLLGVNRMYADKGYREEIVKNVTDPTVKTFWEDEFAKWDERFMREATAAIQNKIGQFTANPIVRNIIGQKTSSFDFREVMDKKKILLINLSKGRIGEQNAGLLGGMLITKIYLAAMSRADSTKADMADLPPFFLFVDEFQNFANESFADILSEARKYKLNLTMAHQYVEQMEEEVRDAVFGNVGTTVSFRVGPLDAELLEKVFVPTFTQEDIVNLGRFQIYLTLMIDGVGSKPFSATTMGPLSKNPISFREEVIQTSRNNFSRPRQEVQKYIDEWYKTEFHTEKQKKEIDKKEEYLREKFGGEYKPRGHRDDEYSGAFPEKPEPAKKTDFKKDFKKPEKRFDKKPANFPKKAEKPPVKIQIPEDLKKAILEPKASKEVSLKNLSENVQRPNISKKDPSAGNKSLLKDALSKALSSNPALANKIQINDNSVNINSNNTSNREPEPPARAEKKTPENPSENIPSENQNKDFSEDKKHTAQEDYQPQKSPEKSSTNGKIKEVPEDILKSILE